jgi:hypothetical protein
MDDHTHPTWYEALIGAGMIGASVFLGTHIVHHPEHEHLYAWAFVGFVGCSGLWLLVPMRFKPRAVWHEVREAVPFLSDPQDAEDDDA